MSILGTIWKAMQIIYIFYFFRSIHYSRCFYLLPVVLLTLVWNIPRFMELETCYKLNNSRVSLCDVNNTSECRLTVCVTEIRRNLSYCRDYILIGNFLIMIFLPLLLLSILNCQIYHVLAKSSRRSISMKSSRRSINMESSRKTISNKSNRFKRDQSIATILITIVVIFGCCNIPRVSINLFEV